MHRTIALLLLFAPCLWAIETVPAPFTGEMPRQTDHTCNDGTSEGYFHLTDVGEGFANRFTPSMYPSRIEAITIAAVSADETRDNRDIQTCVAYVWADAGGQPGTVLWSGPASLDVTSTSWFTVPIGTDVVIASGSFWVGYLDDGSLTLQSPYDDPDACGTYYYYPSAGSWMPLSGLGYPYGVYLDAMVGEGVPVSLASFDAAATAGGVRLMWQTLSETNCYGFYLLRAADEQAPGMSIMENIIPGHGTTTTPHGYSFLDQTMSPGVWFYRLMQVDTDGTEICHGPLRAVWGSSPSSWGRIKSEFK